MKNKLMGFLVALSMMVGSVMPVCAASTVTVENEDTGYTATTNITATITAEMLGSDVIVNVPAAITIDNTTALADSKYTESGTITAKGAITAGKNLFIGIESVTPLTLTSDGNVKVNTANDIVGATDGTLASPAKAVKYVGIDQATLAATTSKTVSFSVLQNDIPMVGTYTGTANYYIATTSDASAYQALSF